MSNRIVRVNELVQRELGEILRRRYQTESMEITISGVEVTPDLLEAKVWVSVFGNKDNAELKLKWLRKHGADIRHELGRRIVLKFLPKLHWRLDETTARGNRILGLLDEIAGQPKSAPGETGEEKK